jgi:hypothetical protein
MAKTFLDALANSRLAQTQSKEMVQKKLLNKWSRTGLLKGLTTKKQLRVARLFENQAEQLLKQVGMLKEATTMSGGNVEGYATSVFPMIRRLFGEMMAENLIGVQTLDKPFGYLMFIDYVYTQDRFGAKAGESIFGGGRVGADITRGLDLDNEKGFYQINPGITKPSTTVALLSVPAVIADDQIASTPWTNGGDVVMTGDALVVNNNQLDVRNDIDVLNTNSATWNYRRYVVQINSTDFNRFSQKIWMGATLTSGGFFGATAEPVRRLTTVNESARQVTFVMRASDPLHLPAGGAPGLVNIVFFTNDLFVAGGALGSIQGSDFHFEGPKTRPGFEAFPEFEVKINNKFLETESRQFKAIWTPQAAQDAQALADVDIETEISSTLTDHVEHEIDRELLNDLCNRATAGRYHWDARPGVFVNMLSGAQLAAPPDFTGSVDKWYQTFGNVINAVSARIHMKILKGGANFIVIGPETATILDGMTGWAPNAGGPDTFASEMGLIKAGSLNKRFDVYVNPQFWRNIVLVGRKGGSNADAGYYYLPYVPLTLTPVIPDPDDFTPRMGIMTRYARFMVRPDSYGLVQIHHMLLAE